MATEREVAPRASRPRKKLSGQGALAVDGDGWTEIRQPRHEYGPFGWGVEYMNPHPDRCAQLAVETVQRRARGQSG